jgi:hypothetical protein
VNPGSCTTDLYIKGTDMENTTLGSSIGIGNLSFSNTTNATSEAYNLTTVYQQIRLSVSEGTNITTYYWLSVPPVPAGIYNGTITIEGVKDGNPP